MSEKVIKFYEGEYYLFSNFSAHKVTFEETDYMTAEHAYQVAKFSNSQMKEKIRSAPSAFQARDWAQAKEGRRADWEKVKVKVMKEIMKAKVLQHEDVRLALLSTSDKIIEKNHPLDFFWGSGNDGSGKNVMGKIWMEIREGLR